MRNNTRENMNKKLVVVRKRMLQLARKAQGTIIGTAMTVILIVCILVCGLYIVYNIETAMTSSGCFTESSWYQVYQQFVNATQTVFTLLPVAIIVIVSAFMLATLFGWLGGGRRGGR